MSKKKKPQKRALKSKKAPGSLAARLKKTEVHHVQTRLSDREFRELKEACKRHKSNVRGLVYAAVMNWLAQERLEVGDEKRLAKLAKKNGKTKALWN